MKKLFALLCGILLLCAACAPVPPETPEQSADGTTAATTTTVDTVTTTAAATSTTADTITTTATTTTATNTTTATAADGAGFTMLRYFYHHFPGVEEKVVRPCRWEAALVEHLSKLPETGETVPHISEGTVNKQSKELPVPRDTMWVECGDVGIFRINPDMTEICKVQTHLGEGKVLQMTDAVKTMLEQAWYYHPYDYWSGTYKNGTVTLLQVHPADSAIDRVEIKDIHIESDVVGCSENNKITLSVRANESKSAYVNLDSYASHDNRGSRERKPIELVKGGETTVELEFVGFGCPYWVDIVIGNTKITLRVNP